MLERTIIIESPAKLSARDSQLVILPSEGEETTIPGEDIAMLLVNTPEAAVTSAALELLALNNAVLVCCGKNMSPALLGCPMESNCLQGARTRLLAGLDDERKGRLWQCVVKAKINNQAAVLDMLSLDSSPLLGLARKVEPGDVSNREGAAAAAYFMQLFGSDFRRDRHGLHPNPMLNYGYTVLRAATTRALLCCGLLPYLGLHHRGRGDAFPLSDDMMEPFRPFVDLAVYRLWSEGCRETDRDVRARLAAVMLEPAGERGRLCDAVMDAASLLRRCLEDGTGTLIFPTPC